MRNHELLGEVHRVAHAAAVSAGQQGAAAPQGFGRGPREAAYVRQAVGSVDKGAQGRGRLVEGSGDRVAGGRGAVVLGLWIVHAHAPCAAVVDCCPFLPAQS